jgi:hypothetical protein
VILEDQLTLDTSPTFDTMPEKDEPQYTHMKAIEIALAKRWRTEGNSAAGAILIAMPPTVAARA